MHNQVKPIWTEAEKQPPQHHFPTELPMAFAALCDTSAASGSYDQFTALAQALREEHARSKALTAQLTEMKDQLSAKCEQLRIALIDARVDTLTGANNRRAFSEAFAREKSRVERLLAPLSMAIVDIDDFKLINDTYGHQNGDLVLREFCGVIGTNIRPSDMLFRVGGEEFAILLPDTVSGDAVLVLERVRAALLHAPVTLTTQRQYRIRFSAGVAQYCRNEAEAEMVARADRMMYQAKRLGKDKICVCEVKRVYSTAPI